jgi:hypothetical protein
MQACQFVYDLPSKILTNSIEAFQFSVFYIITFIIHLKRWGLFKFFLEDVRSVEGPLRWEAAHCAQGFEQETATQHSIELQNVQRRALLSD